jgi:ABC-type dipeptide/oligopeptide/nickel transport system permease component
MRRYLLVRLAWAAPTVLAIVLVNFLIMHLAPGDPLMALVGDYPAPPAYVAAMRHEFGLDRPLMVQLWLYLVNMAHGRLGYSFANHQDVLTLILGRARYTMLLMLPALALAAVLGVAAALASSRRAGGTVDTGITVVILFGHSVPIFWLGQIFIVAFAVNFRLLPAQGMMSLRAAPAGLSAMLDVLWHLVLPGISVTIYYVAVVARVARASVLEALHQDFVLTARAKGMPRRTVLWRHVLPNALIPVVTVIGYNFGGSLTGAILVETVFAWPGLGNLFIISIANRDYPVLQGILLVTGVAVVLVNLATDMLYVAIDPRIGRGDRADA